MGKVVVNKKTLWYLFGLSPAIVVAIYTLIDILQYGFFNIRGVIFPVLAPAGYTPHAYTVLTWCLMYAILYFKTKGVTPTIRLSAIGLIMLASVLISHDFAWFVERIVTGTNLSAGWIISIFFIGSSGGPTYFIIGIMIMVIVMSIGKIYKFIDVSKWFWIFGIVYGISLVVLTVDGYWWRWEDYLRGVSMIAPQGWDCVLETFSGQIMWVWLVGVKRKKEIK